jgi:catalase
MTAQNILAEVRHFAPGLKPSRDLHHYDGRHRRAEDYDGRHRCVTTHEPSGFVQAASLYRSLPADEQHRLVRTLAAGMAGLAADRDALLPWALENFRRADAEFGARLEAEVTKIERESAPSANPGANWSAGWNTGWDSL